MKRTVKKFDCASDLVEHIETIVEEIADKTHIPNNDFSNNAFIIIKTGISVKPWRKPCDTSDDVCVYTNEGGEKLDVTFDEKGDGKC